jgi:glutaredoxin
MKIIIGIILLATGLYFLEPFWSEFTAAPGTFRGDGSERIVIFTSPDCGARCRDAISYLTKSGQAFEELSLDENDKNINLFHQLGGTDVVPYLTSGYQVVSGFYPQDYLSVLAAARGLSVLDPKLREVYARHFDADNKPLLVMYGTSWCVDCAALREYCSSNQIKLRDWDVELNETAALHYELLGGRNFPLVFYGARRMSVYSVPALKRLMKE